jgi:hypothetical protein
MYEACKNKQAGKIAAQIYSPVNIIKIKQQQNRPAAYFPTKQSFSSRTGTIIKKRTETALSRSL